MKRVKQKGQSKVSHSKWIWNKILKDKINEEPEHGVIKGSRGRMHGGPQENRFSRKEGKLGTSGNNRL